MSSAAQSKQCYCGRPLRHTGRHVGSPQNKTEAGSLKRHKLVGMVEAEIAGVHATISSLKNEIKTKQSALLDAEVKLQPLRALLEAYDNKRIAAPVITPKLVSMPAVTTPEEPDDDTDFEPVLADFEKIQKWANVRNLHFKTWSDLPAINQHCERHMLPTFKRKF